MYPLRVCFVLLMQFCERFSFSSIRSILSFYLRDILMYDEQQSVSIFHVFMMLCYTSAMIGGVVGNSNFGKTKTIISYSLVYWFGILLMFYGTLYHQDVFTICKMTMYSLILISIGLGGIKPCAPAFALEQLITSSQNISVSHAENFFSTFYIVIHSAVFIGMITTPTITYFRSGNNFNVETYALRFELSLISMTVAIGAFLCGIPYYLSKKSGESVLVNMAKCIVTSLWKKLTNQRPVKSHWLGHADGIYSSCVIHDTEKTLHMLILYVPLSMFWSLFDQQNTTWLFQAARTNGRFFGVQVPVFGLQFVNPVLVLFTISFMKRAVYPYLDKHWLFKYPLKRVLLGGSIAAIAFVLSGCVELLIERSAQDERISLQWLLPQFICMAFGETLFTMTGLAFTFSEAPETMKTVSLSMWYFSVALGNLMVILFNHFAVLFDKKSDIFFFFSFFTALVIVLLYRMSSNFEKIYNLNKPPVPVTTDLVMILERDSYQLAF